jgi:hypothetical protein
MPSVPHRPGAARPQPAALSQSPSDLDAWCGLSLPLQAAPGVLSRPCGVAATAGTCSTSGSSDNHPCSLDMHHRCSSTPAGAGSRRRTCQPLRCIRAGAAAAATAVPKPLLLAAAAAAAGVTSGSCGCDPAPSSSSSSSSSSGWYHPAGHPTSQRVCLPQQQQRHGSGRGQRLVAGATFAAAAGGSEEPLGGPQVRAWGTVVEWGHHG